MAGKSSKAEEITYPVRAVVRLTGLTPDLLRAWERRYHVVEPLRTPGGTRRYRAGDLERLRLVKAAVDAGHRIGEVARLDRNQLLQRATAAEAPALGVIESAMTALDALDPLEAERLLSVQLSALGPSRFVLEVAWPLLQEIGERWARQGTCIAAEHLGTGVLRTLLGSALRPSMASTLGPRVVFATPSGERHELGLLMAALTAMGAGANPVYLGSDLPAPEILDATRRTGAAAVGLSLVTIAPAKAERAVNEIYAGLPRETLLWLGGVRAREIELPSGVECIEDLRVLEQRVALLAVSSGRPLLKT